MRKIFALALALLLTGGVAIAQAGGSTGSKDAAKTKTASTDTVKTKKGAVKSSEKSHKGGKKGKVSTASPTPPAKAK